MPSSIIEEEALHYHEDNKSDNGCFGVLMPQKLLKSSNKPSPDFLIKEDHDFKHSGENGVNSDNEDIEDEE